MIVCARCGRHLKHPNQGRDKRVYGPVCFKKIFGVTPKVKDAKPRHKLNRRSIKGVL